MKRLRYIMLLAGLMSLSLQTIYAQRITRSFRNTSMSEALTILAKSTKDYRINFMYDELEDFTVTTSIVKRTAPDAIRQIMGFYPMKMTIDGENIFVECTQKTPTKMIGRIIDNKKRPVDFANVALLNVRDSSLINGGVTNENGQFVIPCGARKAIVRVSCVGYITASNTYNTGKIGTIVLHENTINLKGVKVKAIRQNIKLGKEGMLVDIEHSELNKIGTATDVLREMPRVDVSSDGTVNVFAKGSPIIYINNRQVNDLKELHQLKSDNIKNVEIVTAPGAKYNAEIKSVIRIRTIRRQGEGWSGENYTTTKFNKWWGGSQYLSSTYRTGKAEVFGELWGTTTPGGEDNVLSTKINGTKNIFIEQTSPIKYRSKGTGAKVAQDFREVGQEVGKLAGSAADRTGEFFGSAAAKTKNGFTSLKERSAKFVKDTSRKLTRRMEDVPQDPELTGNLQAEQTETGVDTEAQPADAALAQQAADTEVPAHQAKDTEIHAHQAPDIEVPAQQAEAETAETPAAEQEKAAEAFAKDMKQADKTAEDGKDRKAES